jgi:hypothetical protein
MAEAGYLGQLGLMVLAWTVVSGIFTYAFGSYARSRGYSYMFVFVTTWLSFFFISLGTLAYIILGG